MLENNPIRNNTEYIGFFVIITDMAKEIENKESMNV